MTASGNMARSYLFVPGNRPDRFDKAYAAGADAVIVDLEDAVPLDEKARARDKLAAWLSPERPVLVRTNAPGTEWFQDDVALCASPGVAGVMLPKAERVEDLRAFGTNSLVLPLIETALGLWHAHTLAGESSVQRLVFGSIDFQLDLGMNVGDDELLYFRSQLVLVSRVAGLLPPVDGVSVSIDNAERLREDVVRARRLGFGGKLCIHPRQVSAVNQGFTPGEDEVAWARKVLRAADEAMGGAVAVDGAMVDRPVIEKARRILLAAGETS